MDGQFILTQGAGQKLEFAINRNGGNADDIEWLSAGNNFKSVILLARGEAEVKIKAAIAPAPQKSTLVFVKQTMIGATPVTVYGLGKQLAFADMFRALLKLAPDAPPDEVEKLLKKGKHPLPAAQAEEVLESQAKFFLKQEGGEDFGFRSDGWANLILVEDAGSLSVVDADWYGYGWARDRGPLGDGSVWRREVRLVVSNS